MPFFVLFIYIHILNCMHFHFSCISKCLSEQLYFSKKSSCLCQKSAAANCLLRFVNNVSPSNHPLQWLKQCLVHSKVYGLFQASSFIVSSVSWLFSRCSFSPSISLLLLTFYQLFLALFLSCMAFIMIFFFSLSLLNICCRYHHFIILFSDSLYGI